MSVCSFRRVAFRVTLAVAAALIAAVVPVTSIAAQSSRELSSLDLWIVQRYRGAQLLPDSGVRSTATLAQAGAPRVEATRSTTRRDTIVALHFGPAIWRPTLATAAAVQLADPTGTVSGIAGKITARRAFRTPRKAGARDSVKDDWRIGWAYLVAIPTRSANASASGFSGWAIAEAPTRNTAKAVKPAVGNSQKEPVANSATTGVVSPITATQSTPPAALPPIR